MKLCDMCVPGSAENAETHEIQFVKLPTEDCDVPEYLMKWRGELCRKHADDVRDRVLDMARAVLKAGPPTEGTATTQLDAAQLASLADSLLANPDPEWTKCAARMLGEIAARMRGEP
jgi:hypothetical protein